MATCALNQWALDFEGNFQRILKSESGGGGRQKSESTVIRVWQTRHNAQLCPGETYSAGRGIKKSSGLGKLPGGLPQFGGSSKAGVEIGVLCQLSRHCLQPSSRIW